MKQLFTILIALCALSGFAQKSLPADVIKNVEERITNGYSPSELEANYLGRLLAKGSLSCFQNQKPSFS